MTPRRLYALATVTLIALTVTLWVLFLRQATSVHPPSPPSATAPAPAPAPSQEPAPSPTTPSPSAPTTASQPAIDEDDNQAAELIHQAVVDATLGIFYSDSHESPSERRQRLAPLFTPGASNVTDPPLLTHDGANTATEAEITQITPIDTDDPTAQDLLVSVRWGAAWWPNENGNTSHVQGDMDLKVRAVLHDGRWLVEHIKLIG